MNPATMVLREQLRLCRASRNPTDRFNSVILQGPPLWSAQRAIGRALADPSVRRVAVKSGHAVGKSMVAAAAGLAWLTMYEDAGVVISGPTLGQVKRATWAEVIQARSRSPLLRNVGDLRTAPLELRYDVKWLMTAMGGTDAESLQGFHPRGPVLVIKDESSGQNDVEVDNALDSLKPIMRLDLSNPIRPYGLFYELCQRATDDPSIRLITIPSTSSPDAEKEESDCGLADARWLRNMALEHGDRSTTYKVRVLAEFPDGSADLLIPSDWLDRCAIAPHQPGGPLRLAMDLGLGHGGDDTTHLVRDSNGIVWFEASKFRSLEDSGRRAKQLADHYNIAPERISFDAASIGAEFDRRLRDEGLVGCKPFVGSFKAKSKRFTNYRTAAHFAMRRRLDPARNNEDGTPRPIFSIPREFMTRFRRETRELTYEPLESGRLALRNGDEVKAALRFSPDYSVTLAQSFFVPD